METQDKPTDNSHGEEARDVTEEILSGLGGWVRLYRKIMSSPFYRKSAYVHLWVHILLKANYREHRIFWNGAVMTIQAGQFVTGRDVLARETGICPSTVERILKFFENEQQIEQQTTNKFRVITVVNWYEYQAPEQQNEHLASIKRTSGEHKQEVRKGKKEKKSPPTPTGDRERLLPLFENLWSLYPKQVRRKQAMAEFVKLNPDESLVGKMDRAIWAQSRWKSWTREKGRFIPRMDNWLKDRRWEDGTPPEDSRDVSL